MEQTNIGDISDVWHIVESMPNSDRLGCNESVFALGNGSLGFRGDFEEGYPNDCPGVYLNGFYESAPIQYGEAAYGYAKNSQTMLNLANAKSIKIYLDDEKVDLSTGTVLQYRRELSMRDGIVRRSFHWKSPQNREIEAVFERMVVFGDENIAVISCELKCTNTQKVRIISEIDGCIKNAKTVDDPRVGSHFKSSPLQTIFNSSEKNMCVFTQKTFNSGLAYSCATMHEVNEEALISIANFANEDKASCEYIFNAKSTVKLVKYINYFCGCADAAIEITENAKALVKKAFEAGILSARVKQRKALDAFWSNTGLSVNGDNSLTQGLHFNLFQVFQSVGRDGKTSIAAKGLSGEGYEGHYFWDTETYIFPMLLYTMPEIAKALLIYRYSILEKAKNRANEMGHSGSALFAWRTINGDECSAYYPAGSAQYHINADIANAVCMYASVTNDTEFMRDYGTELLLETARLWIKLGFYSEEKSGKFCINCVTGPDEYNVLVNNNCYTNMMAANNLKMAAQWCEWLLKNENSTADRLFLKTDFNVFECESWRRAANSMYFPFDGKRDVFIQDDDFYNREAWQLNDIPKESFPLLLHYHPLTIYRRRVCKQADLVLALLLRGENFTKEQKHKIYCEYKGYTTHDSSLSKAVFGIVASEVGLHNEAYQLFGDTARMDLDDEHKNSRDGLHMANMAGAWMGMVYGFAGMRLKDDKLIFSPHLPKKWAQYSFCVTFRECILHVAVENNKVIYSANGKAGIIFYHNNEMITLKVNEKAIKN